MATEIGSIHTGNRTHIQGAHTGRIAMSGAHTGRIAMSGAHTGMAHMGGAHTGGAHMGGYDQNYLGGAAYLASGFGSMSPVGMGNIDIDAAGTGGWDSWTNAGYFNPSFDYAFPTSVGAIGLAGAHTGAIGIAGAHTRRRKPRQLMDVFLGRDKRNLRRRPSIGAMRIGAMHI
jgi:hypothetical protein